jgi:hypothetical protein
MTLDPPAQRRVEDRNQKVGQDAVRKSIHGSRYLAQKIRLIIERHRERVNVPAGDFLNLGAR